MVPSRVAAAVAATATLAAGVAIAATTARTAPPHRGRPVASARPAGGPRANGTGLEKAASPATAFNTAWAGYAAIGHVTSVAAAWTQNPVTCLPDGAATAASPWVGIDGATNASNDIEQTGTEGDCHGPGKPFYFALWQMFPGPPMKLKVPVRPGDHLSGGVTWDHGHTYTLKLSDLTQHWTKTETKSLKAATNISAEAILEENANELSDFGTLAFQNVTVDGEPIGDFTGHGRKLSRIELGNVGHHLCAATSPLTGQRNFTLTWYSLCAASGIVAGYPGNKQRVSDFACTRNSGTITGHPRWVSNLCAEFTVPKDVAAVWTGKSFQQCHTLTEKAPTLRLRGQNARYKYPASCPA